MISSIFLKIHPLFGKRVSCCVIRKITVLIKEERRENRYARGKYKILTSTMRIKKVRENEQMNKCRYI
jgi:hypothetical protein